MSDERGPERKGAGTYLFVRPRANSRGPEDEGSVLLQSEGQPPRGDDIASLRPEIQGERRGAPSLPLRYRRPRLLAPEIDGRLVLFVEPDGANASRYRQAAAALLKARGTKRRLWIAGVAPGVGGTLTTMNIAAALAEQRRITIVQMGAHRRVIAKSSFGLADRTFAEEAERRTLDLWLVADQLAIMPNPLTLPLSAEGEEVLASLTAAADVVVIDGPAADDLDGIAAMRGHVDGVLLVARPVDLATGRFEAALGRLSGFRMIGTFLNGTPDEVMRVGG
ncbi:MAG: hypothetical protein EXR76_13945 [Myxococcales bacterium]|nr:hypothetical protein [Myxococcales bacterium]